ncbi:IMP dehydrogenase [bacterium]|nr:IMP dehydrogenase [bacterium]
MNEIVLYTDGASRGNPGHSAIGVVALSADGRKIEQISRYIGRATNNIAEYSALIAALELAVKLSAKRIEIRSDSLLLVRQMNGRYRVKSPKLRGLWERANELSAHFERCVFKHIPRTKNVEADKLANEALDSALKIKTGKRTKKQEPNMEKGKIPDSPSYSFDDILILPSYSDVLPHDVDLRMRLCEGITLNIPVLSAAMDTVTESKMAIALAQLGALGVIHRNMSPQRQASEITAVKRAESVLIRDPITIPPSITVREAVGIMDKNNITGLPVVDNEKLVGILTSRDIRFEPNLDRIVSELMTKKLVTLEEGKPIEHAAELLHKYRIEKILVVDKAGRLTGLVTARDLQKKKEHPRAVVDGQGHLVVAAALGVGSDLEERAALLFEAGTDLFAIDTAHGDSKNVIETIKFLKGEFPDIPVIAGNVGTAEGAIRLAEAGADVIKVGIGPGSICTTRVITGVGVPQAAAVHECAKAVEKLGVSVIADGGIRYSGDAAKAIALGANAVMMGNMFAGTDEAPGETVLYEGRRFKVYRGMGSLGAVKQGARDRYFQERVTEVQKMVPEGIEGRIPYRGPVADVIYQLVGGIRASMGMVGAANIRELWEKVQFCRITSTGLRESHPHDIAITKEAPNYRTV